LLFSLIPLALSSDPSQLCPGLENKGNALGSYGKCDEAIKAFDKAIEKKPQYADAWNNKGLHSNC